MPPGACLPQYPIAVSSRCPRSHPRAVRLRARLARIPLDTPCSVGRNGEGCGACAELPRFVSLISE